MPELEYSSINANLYNYFTSHAWAKHFTYHFYIHFGDKKRRSHFTCDVFSHGGVTQYTVYATEGEITHVFMMSNLQHTKHYLIHLILVDLKIKNKSGPKEFICRWVL